MSHSREVEAFKNYFNQERYRLEDGESSRSHSWLMKLMDDVPPSSNIFKDFIESRDFGGIILLFQEVLFRKSDEDIKNLLAQKILPHIALLTIDQQQLLAKTFLNKGLFNVVINMREMGFSVPDSVLNNAIKYKSFFGEKALEENKISEEDKMIQQLTPLISETHLKFYTSIDEDKVDKLREYQEKYTEYNQKQIKFALNFIKNIHTVDDVVILFNYLANQRGRFAYLHNSPDKFEFGTKRNERRESPFGTEKSPYYAYKKLLGDELVKWNFLPGGLISVMNTRGWIHDNPGPKAIENLAQKFFELCKAQYKTKEEAAKEFASFHWLAANLMPWQRGSAAIFEQLLDAIWLHHFKSAPLKKLGVSLDCYALSLSETEYKKNYPNFPLPAEFKMEASSLKTVEEVEEAKIEKLPENNVSSTSVSDVSVVESPATLFSSSTRTETHTPTSKEAKPKPPS